MINNIDQWLKEGPQTKITDIMYPHINAIDQILDSSLDIDMPLKVRDLGKEAITAYIIANYVCELREINLNKNLIRNDVMRTRTASQILKEGFTDSCSDYNIVLRTLLLMMNIPSIWQEYIHKDYGVDYRTWHHATVKIVSVDLILEGTCNSKPYFKEQDAFCEFYKLILFREGLDSWDIGIRDYETLHKELSNFKFSNT